MKPALPSSLKEERTHGSELSTLAITPQMLLPTPFLSLRTGTKRSKSSIFRRDISFSKQIWSAIRSIRRPSTSSVPENCTGSFPRIVVQSPRLSSLRTCLHFYPMMPHRDGCSDRLQTIHCCCRAASIQQIPALDRCFLNTRK